MVTFSEKRQRVLFRLCFFGDSFTVVKCRSKDCCLTPSATFFSSLSQLLGTAGYLSNTDRATWCQRFICWYTNHFSFLQNFANAKTSHGFQWQPFPLTLYYTATLWLLPHTFDTFKATTELIANRISYHTVWILILIVNEARYAENIRSCDWAAGTTNLYYEIPGLEFRT
jgi:hypothetical protein